MRKIAAYMEVYLDLKQKIRDGEYKIGDLLPTEPELEKLYSVSRITVRKALTMLSGEGYVHSVQGKGTEVCDFTAVQRLDCVTSITETLRRKGYKMSVRGMTIDEVVPPDGVREELRLDENVTVYCIQRIRCADNVPISITTNYLKKDLVPGLPMYVGQFVGLYEFIERTYGVVMTEAYEYLTADTTNFLESQVLQVPMGTALLCSKRIGFTEQGPFEYTLNRMVGNRYEFSVHMTGRPLL